MTKTDEQLQTPRLLTILPAHNEAGNIASAIDDLRTAAPQADIVVIDDASSDDTAAIAAQAGARVLSLPINLGVGGAMKLGYIYARKHKYDIAVQFDGDGQHRADQIATLIEPILGQRADLVVGSRLLEGVSFRFHPLRFIGSRILSVLVSLIVRRRITDPTSGFRAASAPMIAFFAEHYPQTYLADTTEALVWAGKHDMRITEVPASMRQRTAGESAAGNITGVGHVMRIVLALLVDCIKPRFKQ